MGFFRRVLDWLRGKSSGGGSRGGGGSSRSSAPTRSSTPNTVYQPSVRSGGGNYYSGSADTAARRAYIQKQLEKQKKEADRKEAFKVKEFQGTGRTTSGTGKSFDERINNALKVPKAKLPEVKDADIERRQKLMEDRAKLREKERKEFHKVTKHRYDPDKGTAEERLKARQRIRSGEYQSDTAVEKNEMKYHPKAVSFTRGALSGTTLGASDLVAKYGRKGEQKKAEEYYQKNKDKTAEFLGEMAGSLASFGLTRAGSEKLAAKAVEGAAGKGALRTAEARAVERIAASKAIQRAAHREALKQSTIKFVDKEVVDAFARERARKLVRALGADAAINATTGALYDVNRAARDSNNAKEFGKNVGVNLGLSAALGSAVTLAPAAITTKKGAAETAERVLKSLGGEADDVAKTAKAPLPEAVEVAETAEPPKPVSVKTELPEAKPQVVERPVVPEARPMVQEPVTPLREVAAPRTDASASTRRLIDEETKNIEKLREFEMRIRKARGDERTELSRAKRELLDNGVTATEAERAELTTMRESLRETLAAEKDPIRREELGLEIETINRILSRETKAPQGAYASLEDDVIPFGETAEPRGEYASLDERMPSTNPAETALNDEKARLEGRAKEVMSGEAETPELVVNNVEKAGEGLPKGVEQAREAHRINTGETVEGGTPTNFSERYDAYKDYHVSQGEGELRRRSKAAASQINAMDSDAERAIRERLVAQGDLDYDVVITKELYDQVSKEFKDDPEHWITRIVDASEDLEKLSVKEIPEMQARCQYLMACLDPSTDPSAEAAYTAAFKLAKDISSKSAQSLNLRRNFVHMTEAGKIESVVDDLVAMLDRSRGFEKANKLPAGKYDRINFIKGKIMSDPEIKAGVEKVVKAATPDEVSEAYTELMLTLNKQNPKTGFDVIQEIRYLNMLGNPKTHIRNVFGSALFSPMRMVSNTIRGAIEDSIAKKAGLSVTKHGGMSFEAFKEARSKNPSTEAGKKALEAFERLKNDILGGAKYDNVKYEGRAKTAAGKLLDKASDFNSRLLSQEDDFFRTRAFKENYIKSYNKYIKKGVPITEKLERQIEREAIKESQIATFNEANSLANALNNIERKAYDANASAGERLMGAGLNATLPFTKVPANILNQSFNYSPAGIIRGLANIKAAARKGDAELLNRAIDQLASGATGTTVMALGLFLGMSSDAFTTNAGKEDYAAKFKKAQGVQNYSVTFKDPLSGDTKSMTLDWLVPTSSVFFMGVELANQMKTGDFNPLDFAGDWGQVTSRLVEPVLETSMLSGLYSTLESMRSSTGDDDKKSAMSLMVRETAQSYVNSLIPTAMGQIARTAYKTDKQISGDTDPEYFKNQLKAKTGLAADNALTRKLGIEPLGADTTAYGDVKGEKKTAGDYAKSFLKNAVSPANIQNVDLSEEDKAKIKAYEEDVKNGVDPKEAAYRFPKKQYKKNFKVGDMDVNLSDRDLSTYNQAKTKGGEEAMRLALEGTMFNRYGEDDKGKKTILKDGYTKEQKAELIEQFKGKSMREVEQWLYKQPQFRSATPAEQKKVIDHMWSLTGQGKSQGAKRVGEQAVIEAQGGDVNEYNYNNEVSDKKREKLQDAIDAGIITYEDAVEFSRNAGKTYYYENDEGGTSQTYFNKTEMMEYLDSRDDLTDEQKAVLFNAFKASNAKEYGSAGSGRRGYRRRGYRRRYYRRRGGGGGRGKSSTATFKKATAPAAFKTKTFKPSAVNLPVKASKTGGNGRTTTTLSNALSEIQRVEAKHKPPKNRK